MRAPSMIPVSSPIGRKLMVEFGPIEPVLVPSPKGQAVYDSFSGGNGYAMAHLFWWRGSEAVVTRKNCAVKQSRRRCTMGNSADDREELKREIQYLLKRRRAGQKAWSFAHHVSLFGTAIISVAIGYIVQLKTPLFSVSNANLSTGLAFCAAVLATLAANGGFERKWRANRLSRGRLDELWIDFMDSDADLAKARERLINIVRMHDQEILGGAPQKPRGGSSLRGGTGAGGSPGDQD